MDPVALRDALNAHGAEIEYATGAGDWRIYAYLPVERLKILASPAGIAWGFKEDFDRWANSRDVATPLPRDAEQFATMAAYLNEHRTLRHEAAVSYRDAKQWQRKQGKK